MKKCFILSLFLVFAQVCLAQAQTVPAGEDIGAQGQRFSMEEDFQRRTLQMKEQKTTDGVPEAEAGSPAESKVSFLLKDIAITGMSIFEQNDFLSIYEPYLNQTVNFKDLETIAEKIKLKYKERGYLTVTVYFPEQEVKDGKLEIRVLEGKMGNLTVIGNKRVAASYIRKNFHSEKGEILNIEKLQKDILRLKKNPDLDIKTVIAQGEAPETSDVTLQVKESHPWHVGVSEDNRGARLTGQYRTSVHVRSSDVTGHMDSLYAASMITKSSFGEFISYNIPVNSEGTSVGMDATYYTMKLGKEFKPYDITGKTQIYSPHISWEKFLTQSYQSVYMMGMDFKSIDRTQGGISTSEDELRMPWVGMDIRKNHYSGAQTVFLPKLSVNLSDVLGASSKDSVNVSRPGTTRNFAKYVQNFQHTRAMIGHSYATIASSAQLASHALPSSEKFQLGGANSVRGYPEGNYLADFGASINVDWVFPMNLIPENWTLNNQKTPLRYQIQPVVFTDVGYGRLKKPLAGEKKDETLTGVGTGLRFNFGRGFFMEMDWAKAVGGNEPVGGSGPSTFYFKFQSEI